VAGNTTATLDFKLAILDGARDESGRANQKPPAHCKVTFETPAYVRALNCGRASEQATLGDGYVSTLLDIGLDRAFDDQSIAAGHLARENDLLADHKRAGT
jgi:hypothetical protein